jgi:hypothetical protein
MRANAAGGNSTSAATGVGIPGEEAAAQAAAPTAADQDDADMGAAMKANQAAAIGANQDAEDQAMGQAMTANAAQTAALASGAQDDVTGVDKAVAANAAAPVGGAAASPAAPAKPKPIPDPKVMAMQQELIRKGAKIKADGIMGPATAAAQNSGTELQASAEQSANAFNISGANAASIASGVASSAVSGAASSVNNLISGSGTAVTTAAVWELLSILNPLPTVPELFVVPTKTSPPEVMRIRSVVSVLNTINPPQAALGP